jgi:uncharacterized repeat protein (TIGR01451 family)
MLQEITPLIPSQSTSSGAQGAELAAPQPLLARPGSKPVSSRRIGPAPGASAAPNASPGTAAKPADVLLASVTPQVRVDVKGPQAIIMGEEATFVVTASNLGDVAAKDLTIRVALPDGVQLAAAEATVGRAENRQDLGAEQRQLVWVVDQLPGRTERQLTLRVVPQTNRPFDLAVDWSLLPLAASAHIEVQQPLLQIALAGPSEITFGETKVFSIVLSNPGTGEAKGVSINLALGSGSADTLNVGTLAAGESKTLEVEVSARETGNLEIVASAKGAGQLQAATNHRVVVLRANLQIEATGPGQQFANAVGAYQVRITNSGNAVAKNVQAAIRLPRGAKYVRGLDSAKQLSEALVWPVGDLAPGLQRTFNFTCQLTSDGDNMFSIGVRSDGGVEAVSEMLTKVESLADLKLVVNDPQGPIPVGEETAYEICITNRGTKAATEVQVLAQFSEGIEPVGVEGGKAELIPGQVLFRPLAKVAPNETMTLKVKARAQKSGTHLFRAEVKCGEPETKLVAEETTRFFGSGTAATSSGTPTPAEGTPPPQSRLGARPR